MPGEQRALDAVEAAGIPFTVTRHGPVASLEEAAAARGVRPADIVKSLVVRRADGDYLGQGADVSWVVMADPDGNEFCVLRAFTADERAEIAETSQR